MISFQQLCDQLSQLKLDEVRFNLDDYMEFVVQANAIDQVKIVLELYFGHEIDLGNQTTAREAVVFVERWGGIRSDQTLYYRSDPDSTDYAMIWPWGDRKRASVKVAQCKAYAA